MNKKIAKIISMAFLVASVIISAVFVGIERTDVFDWDHQYIPWTPLRVIMFFVFIGLFLVFVMINLVISWKNIKEHNELENKKGL